MTSDEAVDAARGIASQRSWPWVGRVRVRTTGGHVFFGRRCLEVWTNADCLGQNVRVVFDAATGEMVSANLLAR
jgi:hypothetical protein